MALYVLNEQLNSFSMELCHNIRWPTFLQVLQKISPVTLLHCEIVC